MKYLERGGFQNHPLMKLTLGLALVFLAGFWVTNLAIFSSRLGFTPAKIAEHYVGSEADFTPPRTLGSMLEVTHAHLAIMPVVILLLTHLLIFAPVPYRFKAGVIIASFGSALLDEGSDWLIRYVHPGFAYLKLASFLVFQTLLALLLVGLAWFLIRSPAKKKGPAHPH